MATAGGVVKHMAASMSVSELALAIVAAVVGGCCDCGDDCKFVMCVVGVGAGVYGANVCGACIFVCVCSSRREQFDTSLTRESLDLVLLLERVIRPDL